MDTGIVEFKFQEGTAIKIKGAADFVATVTAAILIAAREKLIEQVPAGDPGLKGNRSENRFKGLPAMFSPEWQNARTLLVERLGRTPTVGKVFDLLREWCQGGKSSPGNSLGTPDGCPARSGSERTNQRQCWSLKEAAERCGVSYHTLYRAVCRGDLKIIKGFGRMMVSDSELARFVANVTEYLPKKRQR
jgi:hypothetical protein